MGRRLLSSGMKLTIYQAHVGEESSQSFFILASAHSWFSDRLTRRLQAEEISDRELYRLAREVPHGEVQEEMRKLGLQFPASISSNVVEVGDWTSEDQRQANEDGWGVFFNQDTKTHEIQRIDELAVFDCDECAAGHVDSMARRQGGIWLRALALVLGKQSAHTPMPWAAACDIDHENRCIRVMTVPSGEEESSIICEVDVDGVGIDEQTGRANANLIAAAPALLGALQNLVADWERVQGRAIPEDHEAKAALRMAAQGA